MLKLTRVLGSRHQLSQTVSSRKAGVGGSVWNLPASTSWAGMSTATANDAAKGNVSDRIYAPYIVYKGKAALSLTPCLPTFTKLQSGTVVPDRRGSLMLTFWPAIGERKYDWEKRQRFALSATEVGSLISVGPKDSCEFFHDPAMLSSNAGQVRKSLSIKPYGDGTGYFVSLTVVNNILKTKDQFSIPVTTAEFAVMKTACSFALPHIMGWDRMTHQQTRGTVGHQPKSVQQSLDLEWEK